jgi:hypothetical protein
MVLFLAALAHAEPVVKKDGLYDGDARVATIVTRAGGYVGPTTTVTGAEGSVWLSFSLANQGDGSSVATVDFHSVGSSVNLRYAVVTPTEAIDHSTGSCWTVGSQDARIDLGCTASLPR